MEALLESKLVEATQVIEQQLDAEINRLDNLDEDELEKIRERRIAAMKKAQVQKQVIKCEFNEVLTIWYCESVFAVYASSVVLCHLFCHMFCHDITKLPLVVKIKVKFK